MTSGKKITRINIEESPCYISIGIAPEEKKMGQKLIVDVYVDIDSSAVVSSDNVSDTLSYVDVFHIVQKIGESKSFSLIESLGEQIAQEVLKSPIVFYVKVRVHKPHIPYRGFNANVSIEVERRK